jgi:Flp pilus assembly protein CpaB
MTYRIKNVVLAAALAIVAALMVTFYVSSYKKNVQSDEETVKVWVASQNIPEGTSGDEVVDGSMLATQEIARKNVAPGAVSSPSQLDGTVAVDPVYAGEQVTTLRFKPADERGVRGRLTGNQRAVQVPGDEHQLLAGTLREGDHVDVVGNWKFPESGQEHFSRVILRDVLVLKGADTSATAGSVTNPSDQLSVMLRLTDAQEQKLFFVAKNGDFTLELRPPKDGTDSPEGFESAHTLLSDGLNPTQQHELSRAERSNP